MLDGRDRVQIDQIPTGVANLDLILGGGIPAYSINMVAGAPGTGKSTLVNQIIFRNATSESKALYLATLSEPLVKMLRYQQQFDFFDPEKVDSAIRFFDLGEVARSKGLKATFETIKSEIQRISPSFLVIDSFKALDDFTYHDSDYNVRSLLYDLGTFLAGWQITSFLVGEYTQDDVLSMPEFSIADGIFWLSQESFQNSVVRKLQVIKCRGQETVPGRHTFRISNEGVLVFPRVMAMPPRDEVPDSDGRAAFGIRGLDEMMSGGIPKGEVCLVAGGSGTGKTLLSLHFIVAGAQAGEPAVMATFEEHPREHERKAKGFGWDLMELERKHLLEMIYLRPTDLSVDEVLYQVQRKVEETKARRVVINSISGFELALSPSDQDDFTEGLYRLLATLTSKGVTTLLTTEVPDLVGSGVRISQHGISFLADNTILLRYAEIESQLSKVVMVLKMRTSDHAKELRQYQITDTGIVVEQPFTQYSGILSGIPTLKTVVNAQPFTRGLSDQEEALMHIMLAMRDNTAQQLADSMGLDIDETESVLEKLVDTGYVTRSAKGGKVTYRVGLVSPFGQPGRLRQ